MLLVALASLVAWMLIHPDFTMQTVTSAPPQVVAQFCSAIKGCETIKVIEKLDLYNVVVTVNGIAKQCLLYVQNGQVVDYSCL